jgi:hypothetical protein
MTAPRTRAAFAHTPRRVRSTLTGTRMKSHDIAKIGGVAHTPSFCYKSCYIRSDSDG